VKLYQEGLKGSKILKKVYEKIIHENLEKLLRI